jgi:probable F420-dependent oxidoreductase
MKIGTSVVNIGPDATNIARRAAIADEAGFDTLWMSDHIVNPTVISSRYPYRADGEVPWSPQTPWYDVLVSMSVCATVTSRIEIASGVLVLPLREPLALASQVASLDALSGGRITLGIGAGWLAEEFSAIGVDFARRGQITDDYVATLRALWSGPVGPFHNDSVEIPGEVRCEPMPAHPIEILVGGSSKAALRRAGRIGDGWYGLFPQPPAASEIEEMITQMREAADARGRDGQKLRTVLAIGRVADDERDDLILAYQRAGVTDLVVQADLSDLEHARSSLEAIRAVAGR